MWNEVQAARNQQKSVHRNVLSRDRALDQVARTAAQNSCLRRCQIELFQSLLDKVSAEAHRTVVGLNKKFVVVHERGDYARNKFMSTNFLAVTNNYFGDESDTIPSPMKTHKKSAENLSDYVRRIAAEKGLSHVKIADRAKRLGGTLSPGYVNSIIQGHVKSPKVETLQNLALGLGEPEEDLFEIARGKQLSDDAAFRLGVFAMMHRECNKLSEEDKEAVKPFIELLKREIQSRVKPPGS